MGPLVLLLKVVRLAAVYDEQAVHRVEKQWDPNRDDFERQKQVLGQSLEEVQDAVKLLRTGQREGV